MSSERKITIPPLGGDDERVIFEFSGLGGKLWVIGNARPASGSTGYAKGCIFMALDNSGGEIFATNNGTLSSSNFAGQASS